MPMDCNLCAMKKKGMINRTLLKLKDIIQQVTWDDVAIELLGIYPRVRKKLGEYQAAFESLMQIEPVLSDAQIMISFSEKETDELWPLFLVYGREDPEDEGDTLAFTPWAEWLGREVAPEVLGRLTFRRIAAICLHEMTLYGFSEEYIQEKERKMNEELKALLSKHEMVEDSEWDDYFDYPEFTMKSVLNRLQKWLRWGSFSKEFFGQSGSWFVERFIGDNADEYYDEIDRWTLKGALKEVAADMLWASQRL